MKATVICASNRAAAGVYEDTTGPLIAAALEEAGFDVAGPVVVPDGPPVGEAIRAAVESGARAVLTTGGTGLTPTEYVEDMKAQGDFAFAMLHPMCGGIPPEIAWRHLELFKDCVLTA